MKKLKELWQDYKDVIKIIVIVFLFSTVAYCVSVNAGDKHHDHSKKVRLKSDNDNLWKGLFLGGLLVGVTCHFSEGCRFFAGDPEKEPEQPKGIELREPSAGSLQ